MNLAAIAGALAAGLPVARAEPPDGDPGDTWECRAEAGAGLDTNPERADGASARPAELASALVRARWIREGDGGRLAVTLTEAARLYPGQRGADAGASRLEVEGSTPAPGGLLAGASLSLADLTERRHRLDRDLAHGEAWIAWERGDRGSSLAAGWWLDAPRGPALRPFLSTGPEAWWRAHLDPARGHRLSAGLGVQRSTFARWAAPGRIDRALSAAADYTFRGPLLISLAYVWTTNDSTAAGGAFQRHRLTARGAASLPFDLTLAVRASAQWSHYPDPLLLPEQLLLAEGRDSQDVFEARLGRRLGPRWDLALTCSAFRSETADGGSTPRFSRDLISLTVAWRARSDDQGASGMRGTP